MRNEFEIVHGSIFWFFKGPWCLLEQCFQVEFGLFSKGKIFFHWRFPCSFHFARSRTKMFFLQLTTILIFPKAALVLLFLLLSVSFHWKKLRNMPSSPLQTILAIFNISFVIPSPVLDRIWEVSHLRRCFHVPYWKKGKQNLYLKYVHFFASSLLIELAQKRCWLWWRFFVQKSEKAKSAKNTKTAKNAKNKKSCNNCNICKDYRDCKDSRECK